MTSAWDAWWSEHHPPQFPTDSYLELEESMPKDEPLVYVPPTPDIPPLPILHGLSLTIHERLKYMETQAAVFKVTLRLHGQQKWAILKVYHSDDPQNTEGGPLLPGREIFNRESQAYANFIQYGLCRDGVVPHCYGIVGFPGYDLIQLETTAEDEDMFGPFRHDNNPPIALLLEYMDGMKCLKLLDLTENLGNEILKQAVRIHEAHVLHDDLEPRNILVGADGRVVIIDFGSSASYPDPIATPPFFRAEYRGLWRKLFIRMLPDKERILRGEEPWDIISVHAL